MRITLAAAWLLASLGPAGAPPRVIHAQATDSAGIRIVTTDVGDLVYAELADEPALSIGSFDGADAFMFSRIQTVTRDLDGNVIVTDGASHEIRVFDSGGAHRLTIGGTGEGPGEFQWLSGAWPVGDGTIVALDRVPARLTHFDADGSVIATVRMEPLNAWGPFMIIYPAGLGAGRSVLSWIERAVLEDSDTPVRTPVPFVRHGFDGQVLDTVAVLPGQPESAAVIPRGSSGFSRIGMPAMPLTTGPGATGSSGAMAITGGEEYEVRFLDGSGRVSHIARLVEKPRARTDDDVEAYVMAAAGLLDEVTIRERIARFRTLPLPPRLPGYRQLRFADTGELWARRWDLPGSPSQRWDVFSAEGRHLGHVQVPAGVRVHGVSHGQLFGVVQDELDVERVQAWDLNFR